MFVRPDLESHDRPSGPEFHAGLGLGLRVLSNGWMAQQTRLGSQSSLTDGNAITGILHPERRTAIKTVK
jgi:hypothetical protein